MPKERIWNFSDANICDGTIETYQRANTFKSKLASMGETLMKILHTSRSKLCVFLLAAVLIAIGACRIVSTYTVFSHTWDEPAHLACGMELLERGRFTYEFVTPPLGRIPVAVGPYLLGARSSNKLDMWDEGNELLHANGEYSLNLALARLGVLPFFLLAATFVFVWGLKFYDRVTAVISAMLFTNLPPILAHAGLATVDMTLTAMVFIAALAFMHCLDQPTATRSLLLGLTLGLAVLSKFSAIPFLSGCLLGIFSIKLLTKVRMQGRNESRKRSLLKPSLLSIVMMIFVIWAGYQFSFGPIKYIKDRPHESVDKYVGKNGMLHDLAYSVVETPIPAPELFRGIYGVMAHNKAGHDAYFMGEVRRYGWWYFFPVSLAVKTPIPFLLFAIIGAGFLTRRCYYTKDWRLIAPAVCAFAILLVSLPSNLNLGVRYILPIYAFLSILAGVGAKNLWNSPQRQILSRAVVIAFISWQIIATIRVHPDYIPYSNEAAGQHPERFLVESDIDWGQDVKRLAKVLPSLGIKEIAVLVRGAGDADQIGRLLPAITRPLNGHEQVTGWIAISFLRIKYDGSGQPPYDGYSWLEAYEPVATVGKTIRLYYIPTLKNSHISQVHKEVSKQLARGFRRYGLQFCDDDL